MADITWDIQFIDCQMKQQELNGANTSPIPVVKSVGFSCTVREGDYESTFYATVGIPQLSRNLSELIPYNELTKEKVLGWVWFLVKREKVEQGILDNVKKQKSPPLVKLPLPWAE